MTGRALIIGWQGGVGGALLRLLALRPEGRRLAERTCLVLPPWVEPRELGSLTAAHGIDQVIEVATLDTLEASGLRRSRRGPDHARSTPVRSAVPPRGDRREPPHRFGNVSRERPLDLGLPRFGDER